MWRFFKDKGKCVSALGQTFSNCLLAAESKAKLRSITIPAVSSGIYAVSVEIVAEELKKAVINHLRKVKETTLHRIVLVDINAEYLQYLTSILDSAAAVESNLTPLNDDDDKQRSTFNSPQRRGVASDQKCSICMEDFVKPERLKCGHVFCGECITQWKQQKPTCPECGDIFGEIEGNQPKNSKMTVDTVQKILPGYGNDRTGTIRIFYDVPPGKQTSEHPNPGKRYEGTKRKAYLPDNEEGRHVLSLLQRAFHRRLIFTIGRSSTINLDDQVTWNDIHHKTNRNGGPDNYGYPDATYLRRVHEELAAKGIK